MEVKSFGENPWGLYQGHGNVWEWCQDWFGEYPNGEGEEVNPRGPEMGLSRVRSGRSWRDVGWRLRAACHIRLDHPDDRNDNLGFRLAAGQSGAEH